MNSDLVQIAPPATEESELIPFTPPEPPAPEARARPKETDASSDETTGRRLYTSALTYFFAGFSQPTPTAEKRSS